MGEIEWEFDTPVQQAYRRLKVVRARETMEALGPMAQVKPEVLDNFDIDRMARDTATAIGGEVEWQRPQEMVDQDRQARAQEMEQAKQMEAMDKMSKAAAQTGAGAQRLGQASLTIPALQQQLAGFLPSGGGEARTWTSCSGRKRAKTRCSTLVAALAPCFRLDMAVRRLVACRRREPACRLASRRRSLRLGSRYLRN